MNSISKLAMFIRNNGNQKKSIAKLFLFLFLITIISCTPDEENIKIPTGLIPRDTLQLLLIDIHLADAYLSQNKLPETVENKNTFYAGITKKYGYSRATFDSTIVFLATQPKLYEEIYEDIISKLSLIETEIETEMKAQEEEGKGSENFSYSTNSDKAKTPETKYNTPDSAIIKKLEKAQKRHKEIKENRKSRLKD